MPAVREIDERADRCDRNGVVGACSHRCCAVVGEAVSDVRLPVVLVADATSSAIDAEATSVDAAAAVADDDDDGDATELTAVGEFTLG